MAELFHISIPPKDVIGKDDDGHGGTTAYKTNFVGEWVAKEFTIEQLAQWTFFDHKAYVHSRFDAAAWRNSETKALSNKQNQFFIQSDIITVDIDNKPPVSEEVKEAGKLERLLENPFIKAHCFMIVPSSGNSPEKPNWHLTFKLAEPITSPTEYRELALALHTFIGLPCDHQTAKVAQPTYGTLFKDAAKHAAGYHWNQIYVNPDASLVPLDALTAVPHADGSELEAVRELKHARVKADNYQHTEIGNYRIDRHFEQPLEVREAIVLQCLDFILRWERDTDYQDWTQIWMAAHHGAPTENVRDFIVNHPSVYWSDGSRGRNKFIHTFNNHVHRAEDGYTVASLFYLARQAGWLSQTGYEIPESVAEIIDEPFIPDWLAKEPEVAPRLLLQSQTGSGKTQAIIHLWKRLGEPKTVVFVPSIKLATELTTTLRRAGMDAQLYLNATNEDMRNARVLVTTLQTFAMRVHRGEDIMRDYGLIYVEESDQLLTQFSRGGGGIYGSHVRDYEARAGFEVLFDALQNASVVWMADATMSQVSYSLAQSMSSTPVRYVLNRFVKSKASVNFVDERGEAMEIILKGLATGMRIVVACDTKDLAVEIHRTMEQLGLLKGKKHICITKDSEHKIEVQDFISDVETQAPLYDFVAYNSVMASGVSITTMKPDLIVQFCGYLSPRVNLQILNRYRQQQKVICYYPTSENFYKANADEVLEQAHLRVVTEGEVIAVPVVEREQLADLRQKVGAISIGDELLQGRAPKEFYKELLRQDGRKVKDIKADPPSALLQHTLRGVRDRSKEDREFIEANWHTAAPVTHDIPASPTASDLEVACGLRLGEIMEDLDRSEASVKELIASGVDPVHISEVCSEFSSKRFFLSAFARQDRTLTNAEAYLADSGKTILSITNNSTMISALLAVKLLFNSLDEKVPTPVIAERATEFLNRLAVISDRYDLLFTRARDRYAYVIETNEDPVKRSVAFAKKLLGRVGLKLDASERTRLGKSGKDGQVNVYKISNLETANEFLSWRHRGDETVDLFSAWKAPAIERRADTNRLAQMAYERMSDELKAIVDTVRTEKRWVPYAKAVEIGIEGGTVY